MRALLTIVLLVCGASLAIADVRTEARRHFRRGMQLIAEGSVDEGIAELQQAYDTLPHPNVLYNIARAYADTGRDAEAIAYFERYLASDPPDRAEVEAFVAQLRARLAAASEPEPPPPPPPAEPPAAAPVVAPDELATLEEAAARLEQLAESTESEALRERARRLRALADSLRARTATTSETPNEDEGERASHARHPQDDVPQDSSADRDTHTPDADVASEDTASEDTASVPRLPDDERADDLYEEEIVGASRFAESPLDAPNSTAIITRQDIRLTGITNISELLRRVAGVEVMSHAPSHTDVSIRGLNRRQSNKVLFLVDGRSVRLDFLASPWVQNLPFGVEDIERIEVIRGPAAAVYGADAFSGIVNIVLRQPGSGESYVGLSAGNGGTGRAVSSVRHRSRRVGLRVSGGYERSQHFATSVDPERVDVGVTPLVDPDLALERLFFSGEGRFELGSGVTARLGSAVSRADGVVQGISRLRQVAVSDALFAQTHLDLHTPWGLSLRSYWNRFATQLDSFEQPPSALPTEGDLVSDFLYSELAFDRRVELGVPMRLSVGVGHLFKRVDFNWLDDDQTEHHLFAYVQDAIELHETLRATLSFRVDRHPLLDRPQFSPRGSLVWRFLEGHALRVTAGTAFRSPSFVESYLHFANRTPVRGVTAFGEGNTNLAPERMISVELGYASQASDYFALEANLYYNLVFDEIQLNSVDTFTFADASRDGGYLEDVGAFPVGVLRFDNEDATFRQLGAELGVRVFPIDGLDVYANYAIHDTEPTGGTRFEDPVRGRDERTSRHKINAGFQFRAPFGLDLSADFHWVSRQLWVEQVTDARQGVRFEAFPLDAYVLINARVGWRLADDRVDLGVVATNLSPRRVRQHPFGQPVAPRVLGTVTLRLD